MNEAEIKRLQAEAAQAEAEAAAAKAAAAKAQLEAALAAAGSPTPAEPTAPASGSEQTDALSPSEAPAPAPASEPEAAPISNYAQKVADGYTYEGLTFTLGSYMENGTPVPSVPVKLPLAMLNRHGLVAGATGTGKTRTLQLFAESLSNAGVPVFITDIKGDLTGLLEPGPSSEKLLARTAANGQPWEPKSFPTELYTLGGNGNGTPIRTSVTDFGPLLLAKVLGLNETQESALSLIFHWADQNGLALIDLGDLRDVIQYLTSDAGKEQLSGIGGVASATAGVILREVAALQAQGADSFFGEPAFSVKEFMRTATDGRGVISSLELPDVGSQPALFSTFIMWLLAELFQELPEVGDAEKPKLVFFFDEAHLLFTDASKEFLAQVVQTVRLIRSKGVGIFFVTQTPKDVPADVLAQLGAKVQHALRAHTPQDAAALKETVKTFPITPELDLEALLPSLGTGEAIVTVLDPKGRPSPVAPTKIWAPASVMGVGSNAAVAGALAASPTMAKYKDAVDPESATELLAQRIEAEAKAKADAEAAAKAEAEAQKEMERRARELEKQAEADRKAAEKEAERARREAEKEAERSKRRRESVVDSIVGTVGRTVGREILRSIFGTRRK
ncbi:DNA helicase HerA-like ATPase [Arcanobacterium wilhelmae]|uniref:DNA helicase HerA-like ATPase n=1 Tax=Arcanobacterium wilhelmae TaxID=1803177 RepID=A0ABT9NDU6_9ACTO|nr:helicase HerA-like domain-containing protein [Arcanobacterium wilhelmae]MDP9801693.1 DNA helicase HerA-like ATPase [Arcanobacterium wilhelmae]WFN91013.1 DUF853 family protein [Arcanobacterium wilhelmae]